MTAQAYYPWLQGKLYDCPSLSPKGFILSAVQGQRKPIKVKKAHWLLETLTGVQGVQNIGAKGTLQRQSLDDLQRYPLEFLAEY